MSLYGPSSRRCRSNPCPTRYGSASRGFAAGAACSSAGTATVLPSTARHLGRPIHCRALVCGLASLVSTCKLFPNLNIPDAPLQRSHRRPVQRVSPCRQRSCRLVGKQYYSHRHVNYLKMGQLVMFCVQRTCSNGKCGPSRVKLRWCTQGRAGVAPA